MKTLAYAVVLHLALIVAVCRGEDAKSQPASATDRSGGVSVPGAIEGPDVDKRRLAAAELCLDKTLGYGWGPMRRDGLQVRLLLQKPEMDADEPTKGSLVVRNLSYGPLPVPLRRHPSQLLTGQWIACPAASFSCAVEKRIAILPRSD